MPPPMSPNLLPEERLYMCLHAEGRPSFPWCWGLKSLMCEARTPPLRYGPGFFNFILRHGLITSLGCLELSVLLRLPLQCWDYKDAPWCQVERHFVSFAMLRTKPRGLHIVGKCATLNYIHSE